TGKAGSEAAVGTIASGTAINLTSTDRVCTNTNHVGDKFTATVNEAVTGSNGVAIPAGAKAVIQISQLKQSTKTGDPIQMTFNVTNLTWGDKSFPVDASIDHVDVDKVRNASAKSDAVKVGGGAVVGGIIGSIIGHSTKSTVIGAATGAAAGTAVAMGTAGYDGCVPVGGNIKIHLNAPAQIQSE
ncbi:MAG: glycine zipper 2TM domain-containing protein, partial [Gemmatimonas sp.]